MDKIPTKRRILDSALALFSEKGYDGVGVDLIAERAGIKGPSMYRYFSGKEEILLTLMHEVDVHYDEHFGPNSPMGRIPESLEELISMTRGSIGFTMHDPILQKVRRILAMEQFRNKRLAELATKHSITGKQEQYTTYFKSLMDKNIIKEVNPSALALEFVAPITLALQIYDREPELNNKVNEMLEEHYKHFITEYKK